MTQQKRRKSRESQTALLILLVGVVGLWALYAAVVVAYPFDGEFWDARGKFGDMFGAFNALFTACAFAAIVFEIHLDYKSKRKQELHATLSNQLDTLVQLYSLPQEQRAPVWAAIVAASGRPGDSFSIDEAIRNQIESMQRLLAGEDLDTVPTYGRTIDA